MRLLIALVLVLPAIVTAEIILHADEFHLRCNNYKSFNYTKKNKVSVISGIKGCKRIASTAPIEPPVSNNIFIGRHGLKAKQTKRLFIDTQNRSFSLFSRQGITITGWCGKRRGRVLHVAKAGRCRNGAFIDVHSIFNQNLTVK